MKVLYATDIHGHISYFEEIFEVVRKEKIYLILLGGGILPKIGRYEELFKNQKDFIINYLRPRLLKYRSERKRSKILLILGNDDFAGTIPLFEELERENLLKFIHNKRVVVGNGFSYIGYNCVPPTSFANKDFERFDLRSDKHIDRGYPAMISDSTGIHFVNPSETIEKHLSIEQEISVLPEPLNYKKSIYLIHTPPYGTKIDCLFSGVHAGSKAIRKFIEEKQPLLTLHGHIHEAPLVTDVYIDKIGQTFVINPGQYGDKLYYITFAVEDIEGTLKHSVLNQQNKSQ